MVSEETRRKLSEAAKRQHANPAMKARHRESLKLAYQNPEVIDRCCKAQKIAKKRPEVIEAISLAATRAWKNEDTQKRHAEAFEKANVAEKVGESSKKKWADPAWRSRQIEILTQAARDPERCRKIKEFQSRPEIREMHRRVSIRNLTEGIIPTTRTKPHMILSQIVREVFKGHSVEEEYAVGSDSPFGGYSLDVAVPDLKRGFEADGCYWHGCKKHCPWATESRRIRNTIRLDRARNTFCDKIGWKLLRFWEHDLVGNRDGVEQQIRQECL
jgi:very-short-patch-repair endonuclease